MKSGLGLPNNHYAVECVNMEQAQSILMDLYSVKNVLYLTINKSGRFRHKMEILKPSNYQKQLKLC